MKDKALEAFAQENGLRYDEATAAAFGYYSGYHVCLMSSQNNNIYEIIFSVNRGGAVPTKEELNALTKSSKKISNCQAKQGAVTVVAKPNGWSKKKTLENTKQAMDDTVAYLRQNGYADCCQRCGQETQTDTYLINGAYMHLCPECCGVLSAQNSQQQYEETQKPENVVGGVVGAFLGSLLGVLVMVLLDQLGYVAALSGIVLAICTLKGYEMLGGKLTKKGIVISVVVMIIMVYFGNRITWAIAVYQELKDYYDVTFFDCFRAMSDLLELFEVQSNYIGSMVMQYVFAALGAVPSIIAAGKEKKLKGTVHQLGRGE